MGNDQNKHQMYRNSGNTLVVTLISLSAGLLLWTINLLPLVAREKIILIIIEDVFLVLCIVFSLIALLAHFKGYKSEATDNSDSVTTTEATKWFDKADWLVPGALYIFFVAGLLNIILLIMVKL